MTINSFGLLFLALLFPLQSLQAEPGTEQNFQSCSIISSEYLTALQLYQKGLPLEVAIETLPDISDRGKKDLEAIYNLAKKQGLLNTYSDINANYARCAANVTFSKGVPKKGSRQYRYYFCAGENKLRYETLLLTDQQKSLEEIYNSLPRQRKNVVKNYYDMVKQKGVLHTFDYMANSLKRCLNRP